MHFWRCHVTLREIFLEGKKDKCAKYMLFSLLLAVIVAVFNRRRIQSSQWKQNDLSCRTSLVSLRAPCSSTSLLPFSFSLGPSPSISCIFISAISPPHREAPLSDRWKLKTSKTHMSGILQTNLTWSCHRREQLCFPFIFTALLLKWAQKPCAEGHPQKICPGEPQTCFLPPPLGQSTVWALGREQSQSLSSHSAGVLPLHPYAEFVPAKYPECPLNPLSALGCEITAIFLARHASATHTQDIYLGKTQCFGISFTPKHSGHSPLTPPCHLPHYSRSFISVFCSTFLNSFHSHATTKAEGCSGLGPSEPPTLSHGICRQGSCPEDPKNIWVNGNESEHWRDGSSLSIGDENLVEPCTQINAKTWAQCKNVECHNDDVLVMTLWETSLTPAH